MNKISGQNQNMQYWVSFLTISISLALLFFSIIIMLSGHDFISVIQILLTNGWNSRSSVSETLVKTSPVIMCALAAALPGRLGLLNIGAEGQFIIGSIAASAIVQVFPNIFVMLFIAGLAGGVWGALPPLMLSRFRANEAVVSIVMNFIAALLLLFAIHGPMQDPSRPGWPEGIPLPAAAIPNPLFEGTRISFNLPLSLLLCFAGWVFLERSTNGARWRLIDANSDTALIMGIRVKRHWLYSFVAAGIIAGLAGSIELAAIHGRLKEGISLKYGYIGLIAAWVARLNVALIPVFSFILAGLLTSSDAIQITSALPVSVVDILAGCFLVSILIAESYCKKKYGY